MSDDGLAYVCPQGSALIASYDVPLFYFGEMAHHPIRLCDNREENNRRPVYSWVMNNTWETNFKMDLSGFGGVPLHLVAQRGDRPPAGHGGAAGALFRALAFDYRLKNEKKAGILYK